MSTAASPAQQAGSVRAGRREYDDELGYVRAAAGGADIATQQRHPAAGKNQSEARAWGGLREVAVGHDFHMTYATPSPIAPPPNTSLA